MRPRVRPGRLLLSWAVGAASVYVAAWLVPGVSLGEAGGAFLVAAVIAVLNALFPPLVAALRLPLTLVLGFVLILLVDAYAAVYQNHTDAEADYLGVVDLHAAGAVGTYDAAMIEKEDGRAHVHKTEKPTQHGAWAGIAVGAVAGLLFPPSIVGGALVAGGAGG